MCLQSLHCALSPYRLYNKMTMEVILSTAFGRAVDVQGGKGGRLFESAVAARVFRAVSPPKNGDTVNVFRILQFALGKMYSVDWHLVDSQEST